jgi:hypothetical protein
MSMSRAALALLAALLLGAASPAAGQSQDCSSLPASAQKARSCSPRQECLAQVERRLAGPALESARHDCQRLPASGTCYGPETYSPQAECRERQSKSKKK